MEKNTLKVLANSFLRLNTFALVSGLSNEILCTLTAQENAKLPNDKAGGLKKKLLFSSICTTQMQPGVEVQISFCTSKLDLW